MPDNQSFLERMFTPQGGPGGWLGRGMESMWGIDRPDLSILTPRTQAIMQTPQFAQQEAFRRGIPAGLPAHLFPTPPAAAPKPGEPGGPAALGAKPAVKWKTVSEGGWDYQVGLDREGNEVSREPLGRTELPAGEAEAPPQISEFEERKLGLQEQALQPQAPQTFPQFGQDPFGGQGQFNPYTGQWTQPPGWISPFQQQQLEQQQQQFGLQQQQMQFQQEETERRERARLYASPLSWLEAEKYAGKEAVIQPWMKPLMAQQYPSLQAGQAIPGFTEQGGTAMPELSTPGSQLWARMGPTAQQQYLGYQQAQQGIRPEEQMFRLGAQAAPGGGGAGLRWMR